MLSNILFEPILLNNNYLSTDFVFVKFASFLTIYKTFNIKHVKLLFVFFNIHKFYNVLQRKISLNKSLWFQSDVSIGNCTFPLVTVKLSEFS